MKIKNTLRSVEFFNFSNEVTGRIGFIFKARHFRAHAVLYIQTFVSRANATAAPPRERLPWNMAAGKCDVIKYSDFFFSFIFHFPRLIYYRYSW